MRNLNKYLAQTAARACGVPITDGFKMGVELELEGPGVGLEGVATKGWRRAADGSLRGESIEFILNTPQTYEDSVKAVNLLFSKFDKGQIKFNKSIRTSTHVHLNFADKPLRQAVVFFCLFTMLEEVLEFYSGEDRAGNLFCLSSRRTDEIAQILQTCLRVASLNNFAGDRYKYAACNLSTLFKFGTVEIRTMRGADSADQVNKWLSIINDLYVFSTNVDSPTDLVVGLSHDGVDGFLQTVFSGENLVELMSTVPADFDVYRSLLDGVRLIQPLAYEFEEAFRYRPGDTDEVLPEATGLLLRRNDRGEFPRVERLDGEGWTCQGRNRGQSEVWLNGEEVTDHRVIRWNQHDFCFEEYDDEADEYVHLEWLRGPEGFEG